MFYIFFLSFLFSSFFRYFLISLVFLWSAFPDITSSSASSLCPGQGSGGCALTGRSRRLFLGWAGSALPAESVHLVEPPLQPEPQRGERWPAGSAAVPAQKGQPSRVAPRCASISTLGKSHCFDHLLFSFFGEQCLALGNCSLNLLSVYIPH